MKVTVNDAEHSQKELIIEIPYEKFVEVFEEEYKKLRPNIKMPGFRQGKAPRELIIKEYKHRLNASALEKLVNESVYKSLTDNNISPLNQPQVKDVKFEEGEPITFKIYVDVFPEVVVEKYTGFEFVKEIEEIKEEDVEKVLKEIQMENISYEPVEDENYAVNNGDMVVIDFEGKIDGIPFDGGRGKDQTIVVGSNTFLKDFEAGIVGMKKGETKAVEVVFPENYHEKSLSGKKAVFDITVKEIKKEVVPELDDDFAKTVDEDCETLSDLKKKIEEDLKRRAEIVSKDKLYDSIIKRLIDENPFTLPESMVDEQANRLADQALKHYQYMYGISPDKLGLKREDVAKTMREQAVFQIKAALILNKIGEMEEIKVTEEEIDEKIKEYAEKLNKDFDEYKKELISNKQIKNLEDNILTEKIFSRLIELNKVETKVVEKKDEEAAAMANDNSEDLNSSETVDETEQENKNEQENKDEEKI